MTMRSKHWTIALAVAWAGVSATTAWAQKRDSALFDAATAEQPAVVRTLERLVAIETPTGDAAGMAAAGQLLEAELKALGFAVARHKAVAPAVGDNLVGRLAGRLDG